MAIDARQIYDAIISRACGRITSIGLVKVSGNTVEILVTGNADSKEQLCLPDNISVGEYTVIITYRRSGRVVPAT